MKRTLTKSQADARSVGIDEAYALVFWARKFSVAEEKLKAAGSCPDVKRELKK